MRGYCPEPAAPDRAALSGGRGGGPRSARLLDLHAVRGDHAAPGGVVAGEVERVRALLELARELELQRAGPVDLRDLAGGVDRAAETQLGGQRGDRLGGAHLQRDRLAAL